MSEKKTIEFRVSGRVQGVGFRYFTQRQAERLGVHGWVRNCPDGTVEGAAQGAPEAVDTFAKALAQGPRLGKVDDLNLEPREDIHPAWDRFEIRYG